MFGVPGGARPPMGPSPTGPNSGSSLPNLLKSPEMQQILGGLDLDQSAITHVKTEEGLHLDSSLNDVQVIDMTVDQQQVIQSVLGTAVGLEAAIIMASEDEVKLIRKRLGELQDSLIDQEKLADVLQHLGISLSGQLLGFQDSQGGIVIIQSALDEIQRQLDEESEE